MDNTKYGPRSPGQISIWDLMDDDDGSQCRRYRHELAHDLTSGTGDLEAAPADLSIELAAALSALRWSNPVADNDPGISAWEIVCSGSGVWQALVSAGDNVDANVPLADLLRIAGLIAALPE